ncbi:unnamed protein product, partial [Soboliphyme baturini]|uniref:Uncharacterized protein n=1 Tax=Soboliphyme baturini TaxID=241478 RepID=A0A183J251_9BILA
MTFARRRVFPPQLSYRLLKFFAAAKHQTATSTSSRDTCFCVSTSR